MNSPDQRRRTGYPARGSSPEDQLMRALREADRGLTLSECRGLLRPVAGRTRIEQALHNIRQHAQVRESIERRENPAGRQERHLILRFASGTR